MVLQLDYAGVVMARPLRGLMWAAVMLAGLPLVVGVTTLLLYLATDWDWLVGMGLLTLMGGPVLVLVSVGLLIAYAVHAWRKKCVARKVIAWQTAGIVVLMLANLPAAAICASVGGDRVTATRIAVTVQNQATGTAQVKLAGPGGARQFALQPGQNVTIPLRVNGKKLTYRTVVGGRTVEGEVQSWPSAGPTGGVTITVTDGATIVK